MRGLSNQGVPVTPAAALGLVALLVAAGTIASTTLAASADGRPDAAPRKIGALVATTAVAAPQPRTRDVAARSAVTATVAARQPEADEMTGSVPAIDLTLVGLDPTDWAPEHALRPADPSPDTPRDAERELDPEPDAAISPPSAAPSKDPLDRPKVLPKTPLPAPAASGAAPGVSPPVGAPAVVAQKPEPALPPLNAAIKAALDKRDAEEIKGPKLAERRKEREAIDFYYAAHGFAPAWSENGKPDEAVQPVLARLARAGEDALTIPAPPKALLTQGEAAAIAESDLALTEAVVAYARQASGSRIDPASISPLIGARPDLADPGEVVDGLIAAGAAAGDKLQAVNPVDPRYVALRQKLAELHAARMPNVSAHIPPGPTLKIGMHDPRVPLIRSRLSLGATPENDLDELAYNTEVAAAVADFQRANGLPASGALTKRTIVALSGGEPSRLEGTIVANMEMWRWMPRDLGANRIEVNVPEFMVTVFRAGEPVSRNRVVVGKTATPTPLFSNTMKYLIVNPVWNVPESIVRKEFIPKSDGDPSYLESHGFEVSYRHGQMVVKQPSGAKNALGRIKFIFPNDYSVYLHDTPSKSLFAASKRAFSHGCVRVDQPFALAESVLNDGVADDAKPQWSQKRLQKMLGDKERYVYLPAPLPIHIEYFTAGVDGESGRLQLHDDVYDYARRVAAALAQST